MKDNKTYIYFIINLKKPKKNSTTKISSAYILLSKKNVCFVICNNLSNIFANQEKIGNYF